MILQTILERFDTLTHWQIALVAIGLLLQGAFFTIFPEELIFISLGYLAADGRIHWLEAMLAGQVGLLPANAIAMIIGRTVGVRIFDIRPFRWVIKKEAMEKARRRLNQHAVRTVFFTRFIPTIRGPVYIAVGLSGMRLIQFVRTDALASCIQIPLLLALGAYLKYQ